MIRDIRRYVEGCDLCQRIKNCTEHLIEKLIVNEVSKKPWTYLTVDFITKFPLVVGKDTILVVCNILSKIYFVAATEEMLAEDNM